MRILKKNIFRLKFLSIKGSDSQLTYLKIYCNLRFDLEIKTVRKVKLDRSVTEYLIREFLIQP